MDIHVATEHMLMDIIKLHQTTQIKITTQPKEIQIHTQEIPIQEHAIILHNPAIMVQGIQYRPVQEVDNITLIVMEIRFTFLKDKII